MKIAGARPIGVAEGERSARNMAGETLVPAYVVNAAWSALTCIYDPLLHLDVVSLGLVYDVRDENGAILVEMTLPSPGSTDWEGLPETAKATVTDAVGGAMPVGVRVVWDPPWSPAMTNHVAAAALGLKLRPSM
jgi:metal-sulfur cluster biosynthetic enzyme